MLIPNFPAIGSLLKPLAGLVLHYGEGGINCLPSEAAWLSSPISSHITGVPVRVYVSHASLQTMKGVYSRFKADNVKVEPLYFKNTELDAAAILSMMAVGSSESAPLYMQIILVCLRPPHTQSCLLRICFSVDFTRPWRTIYICGIYVTVDYPQAKIQPGPSCEP